MKLQWSSAMYYRQEVAIIAFLHLKYYSKNNVASMGQCSLLYTTYSIRLWLSAVSAIKAPFSALGPPPHGPTCRVSMFYHLIPIDLASKRDTKSCTVSIRLVSMASDVVTGFYCNVFVVMISSRRPSLFGFEI